MVQKFNNSSSSEYIEQLKKDIDTGGKKESGFFDLEPILKGCSHSEHEPPKYIHIPQGKGYRHVCPKCGEVKIIVPPQISF